jgi:hypothetical protein
MLAGSIVRAWRAMISGGRPLKLDVRPQSMHVCVSWFAVCAVSLQGAACGQVHYKGDGTFTDHGPLTSHERYIVDLGPVDLGRAGHETFRMLGLPSAELTLGLRPITSTAECNTRALDAVRVRLTVGTSGGATIISEQAPLGAWTHSPTLIYKRGVERQVPSDNGSVQLVRTGKLQSDGWGSYFTPSPSETYLGTLEVLDALGASGCESRLVALGGGWK